jgi:hypothetical protein
VNRKPDENYTDAEAARRRDEVIRRMANTPPQPKATAPQPKKKKTNCAGSGGSSNPSIR